MDSSRQHLEDKLSRLVRETLSTQVDTQEPPEHVWKQIAAKLESEQAIIIPISDRVPALNDAK